MTTRAAAARRALFATILPPAIDGATWGMAAAVTIGSNLLDFATLPPPGTPPGPAFLGAALLRVGLLFYAAYVLVRRQAGAKRPFTPGAGFGRFLGLSMILLAGFGLVSALVSAPLSAGQPLERQWLALFAVTAVWGALTIRLLAFQAALAWGVPFAALPALWRAQRGSTGAVLAAYCAIVLPFAALHLALTLVALRLALPPRALMALAILDGAVQTVQLALTTGLSVVAWTATRPLQGDGGAR